jgi:hypothetical protein
VKSRRAASSPRGAGKRRGRHRGVVVVADAVTVVVVVVVVVKCAVGQWAMAGLEGRRRYQIQAQDRARQDACGGSGGWCWGGRLERMSLTDGGRAEGRSDCDCDCECASTTVSRSVRVVYLVRAATAAAGAGLRGQPEPCPRARTAAANGSREAGASSGPLLEPWL